MKKVRLCSKNLELNTKIVNFLKPSKVYIPLVIRGNNVKPIVKKDEYVHKGQIIGTTEGNINLSIHSSISGTVENIDYEIDFNGKTVKSILINNDYKEDSNISNSNNNILKYTKQEFIDCLSKNGIIGMGGAGFPTYLKYTANNINKLLINAVECEPFITSDNAIIMSHCEEILETIDAIMEINKIETCTIGIKKIHTNLKNEFDKYIGTYPNIKIVLVNNYYPAGWEKNLIKDVYNISYDKIPSEKNIIVNNVSTIYTIYEALKYNKPSIDRIITISGNLFEPINVLVKIGTTLEEILEGIGIKLNTNSVRIVVGGPMMGKTTATLKTVVDKNINSFIITDYENKEQELNCVRCGKCSSVCPSKLCPVIIMDNLKNTNKLKQLEVNRCVECGLCSYICPSKIKLREKVIEAKSNVRSDK